MNKSKFIFFLITSFIFFSCQNNPENDRTAAPARIPDAWETPPSISSEDEKLANIFKKLEGTWKGNFITIKDHDPLLKTSIDMDNLKLDYVTKPGLALINNMEVEQNFTSENPYFQKFTGYDFYPKEKKTISSDGINKVENGKIFRTIKNPEGIKNFEGMVKNDSTLVWKFAVEGSQKMEYYQETISENFIEIIGYEYTDLDRLDLAPLKWFYGKYKKELPKN